MIRLGKCQFVTLTILIFIISHSSGNPVSHSELPCEFEGKRGDSQNCQNFVECIDKVSVPGECSGNAIFDIKSGQCIEISGSVQEFCKNLQLVSNADDGSNAKKAQVIISKTGPLPNIYVDQHLRRLKTTVRETETHFYDHNSTLLLDHNGKEDKGGNSSKKNPIMKIRLKETETIYDETDEDDSAKRETTTSKSNNFGRNAGKNLKHNDKKYYSSEESDSAEDDDNRNVLIKKRKKAEGLKRRKILRLLKKPLFQTNNDNAKGFMNYADYEAIPNYFNDDSSEKFDY